MMTIDSVSGMDELPTLSFTTQYSSQIEHRLNAVGREITIVVQPSDYIAELKKQLKKMKNHKNYIVQ